MPLFICSSCGCVENTHLVNKTKEDVRYYYSNIVPGEMIPVFHPFMDLRDMMGNDEIDIKLNGMIWKSKDEIKMLCSECNTGTWHNEFKKVLPTDEDKENGLYSKYNMITPFDHSNNCLVKSNESISEYKVNAVYKILHHIFRECFNKKYNDDMSIFKDNYFNLVYKAYIEDPMNFSPYHNYEDTNWEDEYEVALYIFDSLIFEEETKSSTVKYLQYKYLGRGSLDNLTLPGDILQKLILNKASIMKKPHWKKTQPEEDKNTRLKKAEEKRERKLNKRK